MVNAMEDKVRFLRGLLFVLLFWGGVAALILAPKVVVAVLLVAIVIGITVMLFCWGWDV